ncbi:MAG: NADH-quinone oxidoreductase subunit NuoH [Actinomycetota bacterium]
MDALDVLIVVVQVLMAFVLLLVLTIINVWAERKVVADFQNRLGPMRAGPFGILQTVADGLKLFFKEGINPTNAERPVYLLAPFMAVLPAFLIFLNIPWGRPFTIGDRQIALQGVDLNVGLLFILALSAMAVYAVVLAGWASGSKYPLLGGIRGTAQAISYEASLGLALVSVVMFSATQGEGGTLALSEIVARQAGTWWGPIPRWNIIPLVVAFVIFFISIVAETNRAPFDLVEAEQELTGGFHTEYSGMRFAMFFLAEYINIFSMSALGTTLFLGGWNGPTWDGVLPGFISGILPTVWFLIKTYVLVFIFFWIRATLPRLRYDQLMQLGWKRLIPGALMWLILSTVVIGFRQFGAPWS